MRKLGVVLIGCLFVNTLMALEVTKRTITLLPASDITGQNLEAPLQTALGKLFEDDGHFDVQFAAHVVPGFTAQELKNAFTVVGTELISFAYLEPSRIAIFLFDKTRPTEFIVTSKNFPGGQPKLSTELIEETFVASFEELTKVYAKREFQPLPGTNVDTEALAKEEIQESKRRLAESRRLFRELTSLYDGPFYLGATFGVTRVKHTDQAFSNVCFGATMGWKFTPSFSTALSADFFGASLVHLDAMYSFVTAEKYMILGASLGAGRLLSKFASTGTEDYQNAMGGFVFGPGVFMDIPLSGFNVRGDIRFYLGSSSVIMANYGLVFTL